MRLRRFGALTVVASQLLLNGCNTALLLKKQQLDLLDKEYANLQATDKFVSANPNPEILGQASAFVSLSTINKILSAADNISGPIQSVPGATFHVTSVRANFPDGFPQLDIIAWGQKGDLKVTLTVTAVLEPSIPSGDPSLLQLRVSVLKVVPVIQWSIFHIKLWGFAQDLIHAKIQDYVNTLPAFTIPLTSVMAFSNPQASDPIRIATQAGYVDGLIQIPAFKYNGTLTIDNYLFLSDGLHVYLSVH